MYMIEGARVLSSGLARETPRWRGGAGVIFSERSIGNMQDRINMIINSIAVLLAKDTLCIQKQAALLLLKILLPAEIYESLSKEFTFAPDRKDPRVVEWVNHVKEAGKCSVCGSKENLEAHHIYSWADYPSLRLNVNNGVCLCVNCHADAHAGENAEHIIRSKCHGKT